MAPVGVAAAILVCFLLIFPSSPSYADAAESAINCGQVLEDMQDCHPYLIGSADTPAPECCHGFTKVSNAAKAKRNRKVACECLKEANKNTPQVKHERVSALPGLCNVNLPFQFSLNMYCA